MNKVVSLLFLLVLILASCKTTNKSTAATAPIDDTISDYSFRKIDRDKELFAAVKEIVPLDTAYLTKDTLHILTKKILGCDADNFKLFWNGASQKSLPPQTLVKLFQQVDAECKEQHRFHLTYNITPLQLKQDTATLNADSSFSKKLLLNIGGYKRSVKYSY